MSDQLLASLLQEIDRLKLYIVDLQQQLAKANQKIEELEQKLEQAKKDSSNSSKPPSSDGPSAEKRIHPQRKMGIRKAGGQPGHPGNCRKLLPTDQVQHVVVLRAKHCSECGATFHGKEPAEMTYRHQVTELPPLLAEVTEYQCWTTQCSKCGKKTGEDLPAEHRRAFGPRLVSWIAWLTVQGRVPRRILQTMLETMIPTPISLGSIQKSVEEASTAVRPVYEELHQELSRQEVLNVDETGWKTNGQRRWMWAFVAARFVFYWLDPSRGKKVLTPLLGKVFEGVLCTDRWSAYLSYHQGNAQLCWAHLKRDLLGIMDTSSRTEAVEFARKSLSLVLRLFRLWHRYQGISLNREEFQERAVEIEKKLYYWAEVHVNSRCTDVRCLARVFFLQTEKLFEFVRREGVEPTNNRAERALRMAVQWRKICFGNRSQKGEEAVSRLLTVFQTCKIQSRNSFEYIAKAIACHRRELPIASLLS